MCCQLCSQLCILCPYVYTLHTEASSHEIADEEKLKTYNVLEAWNSKNIFDWAFFTWMISTVTVRIESANTVAPRHAKKCHVKRVDEQDSIYWFHSLKLFFSQNRQQSLFDDLRQWTHSSRSALLRQWTHSPRSVRFHSTLDRTCAIAIADTPRIGVLQKCHVKAYMATHKIILPRHLVPRTLQKQVNVLLE